MEGLEIALRRELMFLFQVDKLWLVELLPGLYVAGWAGGPLSKIIVSEVTSIVVEEDDKNGG